MAASTRELPAPELDTRKQGAARANVSMRTFIRFEEQGMPVVNPGGRIKRYDPAKYMPWICASGVAARTAAPGPAAEGQGHSIAHSDPKCCTQRSKLRLRHRAPKTL